MGEAEVAKSGLEGGCEWVSQGMLRRTVSSLKLV